MTKELLDLKFAPLIEELIDCFYIDKNEDEEHWGEVCSDALDLMNSFWYDYEENLDKQGKKFLLDYSKEYIKNSQVDHEIDIQPAFQLIEELFEQ